jgi:hypothetical protein
MKNYFEAFTIPYWQTKVIDWEYKKKSLLSLHYNNKHNMCGGDEQYTDYNSKNSYHSQVQSILLDDLYSARKALNLEHHTLRVTTAWFQMYEQYHHHPIHNHGINGFSSVCYIEYDHNEHEPTRFVCPFNSYINNDMIEFIPNDIEEGSIVFFPSNVPHYVAPNKSTKPRLILSFNITY